MSPCCSRVQSGCRLRIRSACEAHSIAFVLIFMSVSFLLVGVREDCVDVNRHIFRNMPQARVSFEVRNRHIFR